MVSAAVIGPENTTRWNPNLNNGQGGFQFFHAWADGTQGWSPFGWVPGGSSSGSNSGGPPTLKDETSPEAKARHHELRQMYGPSGFGDEDVDLRSSSDYLFVSFVDTRDEICRRLVKFDSAVSGAFYDFMDSEAKANNPSWWRDATPTRDDWGKALVGGVLGAVVFRNLLGAAIGVGISLAGNSLYIEGQNILDPRLYADYKKFQDDWSTFTKKAQEAYKKMHVTPEEHKKWVEFRKSGGNCGAAGGAW
jgi:hypothetical protein